ncbi:GNAT family N-acetyltransferase [Streptacidiphilus monticola]
MILRREDGLALGGAGFHGPPTDGVVEIGYDLAPGARGKGYATETARLLVAYAFTHAVVRVVQAHTEPTNLLPGGAHPRGLRPRRRDRRPVPVHSHVALRGARNGRETHHPRRSGPCAGRTSAGGGFLAPGAPPARRLGDPRAPHGPCK